MSINAISGLSVYEYYYSINSTSNKSDNKTSKVADELRKYGITPTDNEEENEKLLEEAKKAKSAEASKSSGEVSSENRPWADLMHQLGLEFSDSPKDDITKIKNEIEGLVSGLNDNDINSEVLDLEHYIQNLYTNYVNNGYSSSGSGVELISELNNIALMNTSQVH